MSRTCIEALADFVADLRIEDVPVDIRERNNLLLVDALGVALANSEKPFMRLQGNAVAASVREGLCTVVGRPGRLVAEGAAQLNSSAIHGSDFDATHLPSIMHTSAVVFPVSLAVSEEVGASGAEFIAASVAAGEVLIRMGLATKGAMHRLGFQSTAVCAPVALALMAGRLCGLPREQMVAAAGLAASLGAGLRAFSDDGTWGKRVITGWACRVALHCVALAREGYSGTPDALEKQPFGLYRAFVQGGGYDLAELTRGLGSEWEMQEVDLKRYPCSHGHHVFVDSARRARAELGLSGGDVEAVLLHVSAEAKKWWFEPREKKYELTHIYGARFAMPYTVALALEFGDLLDEHLESREILHSEPVRRLVERVAPKVDETLQNANPNRLAGTIEIRLKDGSTHLFEGHGHEPAGQFRDSVMQKYRANTASLAPGRVDAIAAEALALEGRSDIGALTALLRSEA